MLLTVFPSFQRIVYLADVKYQQLVEKVRMTSHNREACARTDSATMHKLKCLPTGIGCGRH
jgi:hypothetical protein